VSDDAVWKKVKDGTYSMFSVGGRGKRTPMSAPANHIRPIGKAGPDNVGTAISRLEKAMAKAAARKGASNA
jgi:hypothetical protein